MVLAGCASAEAADEAPAPAPLPEVLVIATTPLPGAAIDAGKVPGNVQTVSASELARGGSASLSRALSAQLASVNIDDTLDDPFQPDILYRGFEASPVLGTPEGLAAYQNGVRINEAFGDTVNWDLLPDFAIDSVQIVSSNPMYGLNALGAGMSITMKNGFSYPQSDLEIAYGSFEQRSVGLQYGAHSGSLAFYIAGRALDSSGWRDFSADTVRQLYGVLSYRAERASLDLSYAGANNALQGQGAAPVQELSISRELTFTGPQDNRNQLSFLTLNASLEASASLSVQGVLYDRHYSQSLANGNTTNYVSCTQAPNLGSLCQSDGLTPVTNSSAQPLPDISAGGALPIGENDWEMIDAFGRGGGLQLTDTQSLARHTNQLSVGGSFDYASVSFQSGTQVGLIDPQLMVLPSNLYVDTPESSPWGGNPVNLEVYNKYVGAYFTDTFDVTAELALTASGRYNLADVDLEDRRGTQLSGNNRFTHFNPAFGGTYRLRPGVTLYAGWSANNRAPTASEIECSNPRTPCLLPTDLAGDPPNLRQVISHTVELGARGSNPATGGADPEISWNLSVFRTDLHDDIYGIATTVSSGYFANIGATRRQGIEAGLKYRSGPWSAYVSLSYIQATFRSALLLPSASNPAQDAEGNIQVEAGDRLPGIPLDRGKAGIDYRILPPWTVGASLVLLSSQYFFGDESNQLTPMAGYHVVSLHMQYLPSRHCELFAALDNVLNARYATYGILSDPTGIGAPGVAPNALTNGPGVDNRFLSPAPPFSVYGGVRLRF
jgi:iron complex outermembrane recepter protein